jgi:CRP-like cAMP-binding protein
MSILSLAEISGTAAPTYALNRTVGSSLNAPRQSTATTIPRGRALFWQDEQQPYRIEVIQGVVRAVHLLEDGDRQILAFYWPGDTVFPSRSTCLQYTAEAVTNCRVHCDTVPPPSNQKDPSGAEQALSAALKLLCTVSKKTTQQRIAGFLLKIRPHLPRDPRYDQAFQIVIPRGDMADHLGTSLETVCRTLADFRHRGLIDLPNRKTIRFISVSGLAAVTGE